MKARLWVLVWCLLQMQLGFASIRKDISTNRFDTVIAEVNDLIKKYGTDQVLLVVDLDNTILHSKHILGSYAWFKWQEKMLSDPHVPQDGKVTDSIDELLYINGLFFSYGSMGLSEPSLPASLAEFKKKGLRVLCLTSRGPIYWEATIRDLQKNGLSFADPYWSIAELAFAKDFYSAEVLKTRFQFKENDINRYGLTRPTQTMLREGVMFTSGLHKGSMIDLLFKMKADPVKALVFVDDSEGNIASLRDVYSQHPLEVSLFRYSRYDEEVKNFTLHSRPKAMALWNEWQAILKSQDPRKLHHFATKHFQ